MVNVLTGPINDRYGSKRALLKSMRYGLELRLGRFARYHNIDFARVRRLVFVCKGNICRSPLADCWSRYRGLQAESFGLNCGTDAPADPRAVDFAHRNGFDLEAHRTRPIAGYRPDAADLVVAMEPLQALALQTTVGEAQLTLAGLWLQPPRPYIADPYSSSAVYFDRCEHLVIEAAGEIATRLEHHATVSGSDTRVV